MHDLNIQIELLRLRTGFCRKYTITFFSLVELIKKVDGGGYGEKIKDRLHDLLFSREDYLRLLLIDLIGKESEPFNRDSTESQNKSFNSWCKNVPEIFSKEAQSIWELKNLLTSELNGNQDRLSAFVDKLILGSSEEHKLELLIKEILKKALLLTGGLDSYPLSDHQVWSSLVPQLIVRPLLADLSTFNFKSRLNLITHYFSKKMFDLAKVVVGTILNKHQQIIFHLAIALEKNDLKTASHLMLPDGFFPFTFNNLTCKTFLYFLPQVLDEDFNNPDHHHVVDITCTFLILLNKKQLVELLADESERPIIQRCLEYSHQNKINFELRLRILKYKLEKKYGATADTIISCFKELLTVSKGNEEYHRVLHSIEVYVEEDLKKHEPEKELEIVLAEIGFCIILAEIGQFSSAYIGAARLNDPIKELVLTKILMLQAYTTTNFQEMDCGLLKRNCYPLIIEIWSKSRGSIKPLLAAEQLLDLHPDDLENRDGFLLEIARGYKEMLMPLEAKRIIGQIQNQKFLTSIKDEFSDVAPNLAFKEGWDRFFPLLMALEEIIAKKLLI